MALSTRGRGAHSAPSGVTTSFRPPRFRIVNGMCTVIVCASAETVARLLISSTPPRSAASGASTSCPQLAHPGLLLRANSSRNGPRLQASMIG